jgi:hypothetical protein
MSYCPGIRGIGCNLKTLHSFIRASQENCTGLPRELAESLNRAMQPGLVSPGGSDQQSTARPASCRRLGPLRVTIIVVCHCFLNAVHGKVGKVTTPKSQISYWYYCSIVHCLCRRLNGPKIRDVGSNHLRSIRGRREMCCVSLFCAPNALRAVTRATQADARVSCSSIPGSFTQAYG